MKPRVQEVIVVEGRYDKNTVLQCVDATVIETEGFGVFSQKDKLALLRRLAEKRGVIVLTDPDGAGLVIRSYLKGSLPPDRVRQAYVPRIEGKERRKAAPSRDGSLGVEGMDRETILTALRRAGATFEGEEHPVSRGELTKTDLYELGLSGGPDSAHKRRNLLRRLSLPENLSAKAMFQVLQALYTRQELAGLLEET